MKKVIAIITIVATATIAFAGEVRSSIEGNLKKAVASGDAAAAANWAAALNSLKQAKLADEQAKLVAAQNNVVSVYGNVIKSAPAVLQMMQYYNSQQTHPDGEMNDVIGLLKVALKLTTSPITAEDLKPVVDNIVAREKKLEAEHEAWLKNRK